MVVGVIVLFVVAFTPLVLTISRIVWLNREKLMTAPDKSSTNSLAAGKAAGARVAFGVQFGALSVGFAAFCIGVSRWVLSEEEWPIQFFSIMPLWPAGGALMLLSVRPTDKIGTLVATPLVQIAAFYFALNLISFPLSIARDQGPAAAAPIMPVGLIGLSNLVCGLLLFRNYLVHPSFDKAGTPRARLGRLWRSYRIFAGGMSFFFLLPFLGNLGLLPAPPGSSNSTDGSGAGSGSGSSSGASTGPPPRTGGDFTQTPDLQAGPVPEDAPGAGLCVLVCLIIAFGLKPAVRRRIHGFLGGLAAKGEAKAAATVAGLVGGRSPAEALKHGTETFRGLPMTALAQADFETNADTGLHSKTVKKSLGEVQAFLSHSWHDDASAKWTALSTWSSGKKEPTIWLDKACIDQQKIDESLAALPVYLSGCQDLLVVVGPTYTRRLWCVMELFVFLQMGGELSRVTALALPGREVQRELATFNAANAQCFKPEDRERLLGIIESAFGDFGSFNAKVRQIFVKRSATLDSLALKGTEGQVKV